MIKLKKKDILFAIFILAFFTPVVLAEIAGSKHDFSSQGWSGGNICIVCHTPHNAMQLVNVPAPLWNHELSTANYTLYASPTMDETTIQPLGISKLCLSCHDGTVALDSFGGDFGGSFISEEKDLGTDLSDDHPISITWTHQTIDNGCMPCHDNIGEDPAKFPLPFYKYSGGPAKVECSTCHDPHDNRADGPNMLRWTNEDSELCLTCHSK